MLYQLSYAHHLRKLKTAGFTRTHFDSWPIEAGVRSLRFPLAKIGAPGRIRTCYRRLRRPMLYPNELQAHTLRYTLQALSHSFELANGGITFSYSLSPKTFRVYGRGRGI